MLHFAFITGPNILHYEKCPLFFSAAFRTDLSSDAIRFLHAVEIL